MKARNEVLSLYLSLSHTCWTNKKSISLRQKKKGKKIARKILCYRVIVLKCMKMTDEQNKENKKKKNEKVEEEAKTEGPIRIEIEYSLFSA